MFDVLWFGFVCGSVVCVGSLWVINCGERCLGWSYVKFCVLVGLFVFCGCSSLVWVLLCGLFTYFSYWVCCIGYCRTL